MTSKGQITLPSKWRKDVGTKHVVVERKGNVITIAPARIEEREDEEGTWEVIFNKDRDNGGKGIPIDELIQILEKHKKQDEKVRKAIAKAKRKK